MDDNKVSHMDDNVNSMVADNIEEKFGKLSRKTGNNHTFHGMDIEFICGKKVTVSTPHHVDEDIEDFGETLKRNLEKSTTLQLFTITSEAKELEDEKKERYHSITAKILWIMKRSRPNLETAVSFLCTRVQCPTKEDWGELMRFLNYLKATKNDKMIMGSDNLLRLETWVDA